MLHRVAPGALLAVDMGGGKTGAVSFAAGLAFRQYRGLPFIVLAPVALFFAWLFDNRKKFIGRVVGAAGRVVGAAGRRARLGGGCQAAPLVTAAGRLHNRRRAGASWGVVANVHTKCGGPS